MWQVILRTADLQPHRIKLDAGETIIGREQRCSIVVDDPAASRKHAKFLVNEDTNSISVMDLKSTNGTYVNSERISEQVELKDGDAVRIGQVVLTIQPHVQVRSVPMARSHSYTRELVLESLDQHAILLYEVARKLNLVSSASVAIAAIVDTYTKAMGVDVCRVILKADFDELAGQELNYELAMSAIQNRSAEVISAEMYIPVITGEDVLAFIYMKKSSSSTRPFDHSDLQLAIAISYQFSQTLHRLQAIEQMHEEENIKRLLMRFFAPLDAETFIKTYQERGELPGLEKQKVTVMFTDIADSTSMAETLGAVQFASILSAYYESVTEIVFKHNGIVKFLGDGVLAIFPERTTQDTEKEAVLAAHELIAQFRQTGSLEDGRKTVIGVSINTGNTMLGYVGTKERAEFNVLGDVVNVAFRLQEYSRPNKIIVSSSTIAAISEDFKFKRVGAVSLKGRMRNVQAFEVLPRENPPSSEK